MKPVRAELLAAVVWFFAALAPGQTPRAAVGSSTADGKAREVAPRAASSAAGVPSQKLAPAAPPISGSIAAVPAQGIAQGIFSHREDVFLAVGPTSTPCEFAAYLSDGPYYFQVTDASGKTLLSSDPVSERAFTVTGGVLSSYDGTTHATDGQTACGSLEVELAPYDDAGPMQALYVVWVTSAASFVGDPTQVDPVCGTGCFHGFPMDASLAAAFRVEDKASCDPSYCASGVAFDDVNGNGIQDAGEPGLEGVPIRVESSSGLVLTTITGPDGSFQICGLASGDDFLVTSPAPLGFSKTGPVNATIANRVFAKDFAYVIEVCLNNVENLTFPNQPIPGTIGGLKFQDTNGNGMRDPGEPPISGVTIILTGTPQTEMTTTAADGSFLFSNVAPGLYILLETVPTGFTQTVPPFDGISVTLAANGSSLDNLFGNFPGILTGTISGTKFLDTNGNGVRDPGEGGQAGVTFTLGDCPVPASLCSIPPIATTQTAVDGSFAFTGVRFRPQPYILSEVVPAGYRLTTPASPDVLVSLGVTVPNVTGLLFGNQAIGATIAGTKFNDVNGNGVRDAGEPGLAGVTITLTPTAGGAAQTTTTAADGSFSFAALAAGTYLVTETVPAGFVQTTPGGAGTISVTVATGDVRSDLLFGNEAVATGTGSISGIKYFDIDANGVVDMPPDRPLQGVTIKLTDSQGHTQTTVSGADGTFQFINLAPGTYTLSETIPPGFAQTLPGTPDAPRGYTITLTPGQKATGYLFLNKC